MEEVDGEEEEVHDGVANVLTTLGHYVHTPNGKMVRMSQDTEYEDNVIYRYVLVIYFSASSSSSSLIYFSA